MFSVRARQTKSVKGVVPWNAIDWTTRFRGPCVPDLGLRDDDDAAREYDDRVYVLRCAPQREGAPFVWYVGSARKSTIADRIRMEMTQGEKAADFCKKNKPIQVEFVWPVASPAAEAYVYYAMLHGKPPEAVQRGRVGGWTSNQAAPDDFNRLMVERDRRMLAGVCLSCGEAHMARQCKDQRKHDTCDLKCGRCASTLKVTSNGQVVATVPSQAYLVREPGFLSLPASSSAAPSTQVASTVAGTSTLGGPSLVQGQKRTRASTIASPVVPPRPAFKRVLVCDVEYTNLMWYNGGKQPGSHRRARVRKLCAASALRFENGDYKSLERFATPQGRELMPQSTYLPSSTPRPTVCKSSAGVEVKLSRPGCISAKASMRGFLLRVSDLRNVFVPH